MLTYDQYNEVGLKTQDCEVAMIPSKVHEIQEEVLTLVKLEDSDFGGISKYKVMYQGMYVDKKWVAEPGSLDRLMDLYPSGMLMVMPSLPMESNPYTDLYATQKSLDDLIQTNYQFMPLVHNKNANRTTHPGMKTRKLGGWYARTHGLRYQDKQIQIVCMWVEKLLITVDTIPGIREALSKIKAEEAVYYLNNRCGAPSSSENYPLKALYSPPQIRWGSSAMAKASDRGYFVTATTARVLLDTITQALSMFEEERDTVEAHNAN
jgi:hypothetical protein